MARVRFASANCQHFPSGHYAAHRAIAREDLDFVVHLGDYVYEGGPSGSSLRDHTAPDPLNVGDYRRRHALYKGDRSLREAHAAHPWFLTWDDHEVANDYSSAGTGAPSCSAAPPRTRRGTSTCRTGTAAARGRRCPIPSSTGAGPGATCWS